MLKTNGSSNLAPEGLGTDEVVGGDDKTNDRNPIKKSKNAKFGIQMRIEVMGEPTFLTPGAKKAFN